MSYLDRICDRKRREIRASADVIDLARLQAQARPCTTDALPLLRRGTSLRVIAEHKRRSPSRGPIRPGSDAAAIARAYEEAGAAAVSVLTDETDFDGRPDDLRAVRAAVNIPVLRKDFILSPMQILEARAWGADLVLLIVAALSKAELHALFRLATDLRMTTLVEVHDEHELAVAGDLGAQLIGVNNRNLHTFTIDLGTSEHLAPRFPAGAVKVSESGIDGPEDVRRLEAAGYDAVLVGERLMRAPDPGRALRELMAAP